MPSQKREAAIVGIHEFPLRYAPGVTALEIKVDSIRAALDDAGLKWSDIDAIFEPNSEQVGPDTGGGLMIAPYLGLKPNLVDTTRIGGSSYEFAAAHALYAIRSGKCKVAMVSYGSAAASHHVPIGTGGATGIDRPNWQNNMEDPYGQTLISNYAMVATRHRHQYGTTTEQLAEISVATRYHATRNPEAVKAMTDLQFQGVGEISVEDVVDSRVIADPLHLLECCMVSDGGGAVIFAAPEIARNCKKPPVWIIGAGEATKYRENGGDITVSAAAQSGPVAFGEAQLRPAEIDIAMIYDSFSITVAVMLEDLGFCKKGEVGDYVKGGKLRFDQPGGPALNTDGGGLSSNHPGQRGIFLLLESVRQLRGESTSQVPNARLAVAHGNGGQLGGNHSGGTIIMTKD